MFRAFRPIVPALIPAFRPSTLGVLLMLSGALLGRTSLDARTPEDGNFKGTPGRTRKGATSQAANHARPDASTSPEITEFSADKPIITEGNGAVLMARFKGGVALLNPGKLAVQSSVPITVGPEATTKYTLELTPANGKPLRRSLRVEVVPAPRILSFRSDPPGVVRDNAATLYAVYENGTGVVEGDLGVLPGDGVERFTGPLSADSSFLLTVTNRAGDAVTAGLSVTVEDPQGPSITLKITPETLFIQEPGSAPSEEAILSWDAWNAQEVTVDQGIGTVSPMGELVLHPENSTTYTFTAKDADGRESTAQATLHVVPVPPPLPPP